MVSPPTSNQRVSKLLKEAPRRSAPPPGQPGRESLDWTPYSAVAQSHQQGAAGRQLPVLTHTLGLLMMSSCGDSSQLLSSLHR